MNGYNYMTIRLTPSLTNDEFANVGVLLLCEKLNYLKIRILDRLSDRIKGYFTGTNSNMYRKAAADIKEAVTCHSKENPAEKAFLILSQAMLGLLSFGNVRLLVSEKQPDEVLQELFNSYVANAQESSSLDRLRMIERTITREFKSRPWFSRYKRHQFTDDRGYQLNLKFVAEMEKCVLPMDLDYANVKMAVDNTFLWGKRIQMFSERLPRKIIVSYRLTTTDGIIKDTALDFLGSVSSSRVITTDVQDLDRLEHYMAI